MKISDIGGEIALIKRLTDRQQTTDPTIIKGVGDDCAVLDAGTSMYQVVTADMMVENDHFDLKWFSPEQIGSKLVECNVSDITSMGGTPAYGIISMSLPPDTDLEFMDAFYDGIYAACSRHGLRIIGGDTTHGTELVFNMTMLGHVEKEFLRTRAMAQEGDAICVTGQLGGSAAGLMILTHGLCGNTTRFLEPRSRTVEEGKIMAKYAHAMIDVSDGLGSEVAHICDESHVGAEIYHEAIPISDVARKVAESLSTSPQDYALYGGEDFELVFTISSSRIDALRTEFKDFTVVGMVLAEQEGIMLNKNGIKSQLKRGFDHFS